MDHRGDYEPFDDSDPYLPLWRAFTAEPRRCFEMDPIAWGHFPDKDTADNPTCEAADLAILGHVQVARRLLMDTLATDLRCIDAHAHLGSLEFDHSVQRALIHYDVGRRIAELSLSPGFDGVLRWGRICNRPYLRCLHGLGLCLWRQGDLPQAQQVFERILWLNPNDNQGVRFCWDDVRRGRDWQQL